MSNSSILFQQLPNSCPTVAQQLPNSYHVFIHGPCCCQTVNMLRPYSLISLLIYLTPPSHQMVSLLPSYCSISSSSSLTSLARKYESPVRRMATMLSLYIDSKV